MGASSSATATAIATRTALTDTEREGSTSRWSKLSARRTFICCLALTALVLAAYNPITQNSFVNYDDEGYILNNAHVRAGLTWDTVKWAFTTYDQTNWHPLTWLSHALDCDLFGMNPAGHHYMSVLLHAMSAVVLFLLLQSATGFGWRSLMVAALFALHPINVESVAWASERKRSKNSPRLPPSTSFMLK